MGKVSDNLGLIPMCSPSSWGLGSLGLAALFPSNAFKLLFYLFVVVAVVVVVVVCVCDLDFFVFLGGNIDHI